MIGRTIDRYSVVEKLGQGGMGVVYKARDTVLERFVALKVLPPDKSSDSDRRRRFLQEAKSASALNHPGIVAVYDVLTVDGQDVLVMELVDGETLEQLLARKRPALSETLGLAIEIADALARAHAAGIVHRDLKPSNVMVTSDGVKVLDFGLAKLIETPFVDGEAPTVAPDESSLTHQRAILGTVGWMSPEQASGDTVDARSDIFAFGVLMYEMLTGQHPFRRRTTLETLAAIREEEPERRQASCRAATRSGASRPCAACARTRARRWQSSVGPRRGARGSQGGHRVGPEGLVDYAPGRRRTCPTSPGLGLSHGRCVSCSCGGGTLPHFVQGAARERRIAARAPPPDLRCRRQHGPGDLARRQPHRLLLRPGRRWRHGHLGAPHQPAGADPPDGPPGRRRLSGLFTRRLANRLPFRARRRRDLRRQRPRRRFAEDRRARALPALLARRHHDRFSSEDLYWAPGGLLRMYRVAANGGSPEPFVPGWGVLQSAGQYWARFFRRTAVWFSFQRRSARRPAPARLVGGANRRRRALVERCEWRACRELDIVQFPSVWLPGKSALYRRHVRSRGMNLYRARISDEGQISGPAEPLTAGPGMTWLPKVSASGRIALSRFYGW